MAAKPSPPAKPGAKGGGNFLTRKTGPLPNYAWAAALIGLYLLWRSRKASGSSSLTPPATSATVGPDGGTSGATGGGAGGGAGTGSDSGGTGAYDLLAALLAAGAGGNTDSQTQTPTQTTTSQPPTTPTTPTDQSYTPPAPTAPAPSPGGGTFVVTSGPRTNATFTSFVSGNSPRPQQQLASQLLGISANSAKQKNIIV